jgi:phospholipid transport system substrate-binding protein
VTRWLVLAQIAAGVVCLFLITGSAMASQGAATDLVRDASERMLSTLEKRRSEIDRNPRLIYSLVDGILVPHFDFQRITRAAVGKPWGDATPQQQKDLVREFQEILIRTYAKSLLSYSGQEIRYLPEKPGRSPGTVTVTTEVREAGSPPIPVDYRLYENSGSWKVYDVIIDQVSLVANYRSSFSAQIRQGGIDGLINRLREMNSRGEG